MSVILPPEVDYFPHPHLSDIYGFLAMGSSLTEETLLLAYQFGIFPWNNPGDPLMWFSTHPRCVLFPDDIKISKSMRSYLNQDKFHWTIDKEFESVISECQQKQRPGQSGTWITEDLKEAMIGLHNKGWAHSVEVWNHDNQLVGGLYGIALGKIFFGESMFASESNASKFGFIKLVQYLSDQGYWMIDCQQETKHLVSLGATLLSKEVFLATLKKNIFETHNPQNWVKTV